MGILLLLVYGLAEFCLSFVGIGRLIAVSVIKEFLWKRILLCFVEFYFLLKILV